MQSSKGISSKFSGTVALPMSTAHLILFCPTETVVKILGTEGIKNGVYLTGDVMVDTLKENIKIAE